MRIRYGMVALICGAVAINYLDRALLGVALPSLQQEFGLQATSAGLLLSAFSWTYFLAQLPSGVLLDRVGVKATYVASIALWSLVTLLHGLLPPWMTPTVLLLIPLLVWDLATLRRIHRTTVKGGLVVAAALLLSVPIGMSKPWHALVTTIIGSEGMPAGKIAD